MTICADPDTDPRLDRLLAAYRERYGAEPPWLAIWMYCRPIGPEAWTELAADMLEASLWAGRKIIVPRCRPHVRPAGLPWSALSRQATVWEAETCIGLRPPGSADDAPP